MKVTGLERLVKVLEKIEAQTTDETVVVGYTQNYALFVHEDLNANHAPGKTAKYLERPARQLDKEIRNIVVTVYGKTHSMQKALLMGGLRLLRGSQEIVPIDTAALKASGFCALERDADAAASSAYSKGEALRKSAGRKRIQRGKKKK